MKKGTRIALAATAGALLAVAGGAIVAASRFICDVAIKRDIKPLHPILQKKLSGGAYDDPMMEEIMKVSDDARSLPTETVTITNEEGMKLTGHYYPAENPKRIIIAMHGWRSSWWHDYGYSCEFYHNAGCALLYPDQRGTGDSDGDYIGFGVLERADCLAWINYAVERFGTEIPIYLVGISMGATTVLMTLGYQLPASVKGVIADCGFTSPHAIITHVMSENMGVSDKLSYPIINAICNKKAQFDGDGYSTVDALKENEIPVLFVHGGKDKFVPVHMTFENYEACKGEKELLIVPGAGHGLSYVVETDAYRQKVLRFFKKYD